MKINLPFRQPEKYPLTQKFGEKFLYQGKICTHQGIDYAMPKYTQIVAPFDGVVTRITPDRTTGYGRAVYFEAKEQKKGKIWALMAHLELIEVEKDWNIKAGQMIGKSGRTGFWRGVNGYHLHFGLNVCGEFIDPLPYMKNQQTNEDQKSLFNQEDDSKIKSALGPYTVVSGDSLWKIAEKYYKNGGHFMEIFRANQDILEKPNLIKPGQILRIPALKNNGI